MRARVAVSHQPRITHLRCGRRPTYCPAWRPLPPAARTTVATYGSYREAERAVDFLSDREFPVERAAIVGTGLKTVEQIAGRLTTGRAALLGAGQGAMIGLLFGLLFGLFFDRPRRSLASCCTAWSPGSSSAPPSGRSPRPRRAVVATSPRSARMQAEHYEVQVDHEVSAQAKQLLAELPPPRRRACQRPRSTATAAPATRGSRSSAPASPASAWRSGCWQDGVDDLSCSSAPTTSAAPGATTPIPGCQCDIPSALYSFSFAPNPDWSRPTPLQSEIREYLRRVADRARRDPAHPLRPRARPARPGTTSERRWRVETSQRRARRRDVLVGAMGGLTEPQLPDVARDRDASRGRCSTRPGGITTTTSPASASP